MQPTFDEFNEGSGSALLCPSCGGNCLHHDRIEIFEREEDENNGIHVTVSRSDVTIDQNLSDNPSLRRNGVRVHFWCETCKAKPFLNISQHKGLTLVDFLVPS